MTPTFDLVDQPWIPCIGSDGSAAEVGLRRALAEAPGRAGLAGDTPLETAALYRLLLAVVHRVFGPRGYGDWCDLWEAGSFDRARIDDYLERWRSRFDLFDSRRPFYQAADDRVSPKVPNSLILDLAFGNKGTLFDHHTDQAGVRLAPARAARALVTAQAFGLAGLSGLPEAFTDAPCTRGVLFLVHGDSLFQTLLLNLIRYPTDNEVMPHSPDDRPAWEMEDAFFPPRRYPLGYLDYLTWQNRRVRLVAEETAEGVSVRSMTMAPGLRLADEVLDPMKHYRRDEQRGALVQRFNEERALWRDSAALFRLRGQGYRPPRTLNWLAELVLEGAGLEPAQTRRLVALGMANNQARVDFYREERMPLPLRYLTDEALVGRLEEALAMAAEVGRQLWGASQTLARLVLAPLADTEQGREAAREDVDRLTARWAVEREYWSRLEVRFRELVEGLPSDAERALGAWRSTLRATAWSAFEGVAADLELAAHNMKAAVQARRQLAMGLGKVLPE